MAYQHHSDEEFTKLETQYKTTVADMRSTIDDLHAELSELAKVAHAAMDERDRLNAAAEAMGIKTGRAELADMLQEIEKQVIPLEAMRIWRNSYNVTPGDVKRQIISDPTPLMKLIRQAIAKAE